MSVVRSECQPEYLEYLVFRLLTGPISHGMRFALLVSVAQTGYAA